LQTKEGVSPLNWEKRLAVGLEVRNTVSRQRGNGKTMGLGKGGGDLKRGKKR